MIFTRAGHGVDQPVEILMTIRGGALEGQIPDHRESGGRQDRMGTHNDLCGNGGTRGGTQQRADSRGPRARQPTSAPLATTCEDQQASIAAATDGLDFSEENPTSLLDAGGCQTTHGNA